MFPFDCSKYQIDVSYYMTIVPYTREAVTPAKWETMDTWEPLWVRDDQPIAVEYQPKLFTFGIQLDMNFEWKLSSSFSREREKSAVKLASFVVVKTTPFILSGVKNRRVSSLLCFRRQLTSVTHFYRMLLFTQRSFPINTETTIENTQKTRFEYQANISLKNS